MVPIKPSTLSTIAPGEAVKVLLMTNEMSRKVSSGISVLFVIHING